MSNDGNSSAPAGVPAGWYDDPSGGGGRRWWDGANWTSHVQAPLPVVQVPVVQVPVVQAPAVPSAPFVANQQPVQRVQRVKEGAHETRAAWWIAFSPLWSAVGQAVVFSIVLSLLSLPTAELLPEIVVLNVVLWALVLVFAFNDRAKLVEAGIVGTASPYWVLLTPIAYLIARALQVRLYGSGAWTPVVWWCIATVLAPGLSVLAVFAAFGIFSP